MGLFGAFIPVAYGGFGLDYLMHAMVVEENGKGWMSAGRVTLALISGG